MKTHYENVSGSLFAFREVVDEYDTFQCDRGHKWEETFEHRFDLPQMINFPTPNGENLCPFCLDELLSNIGRVLITKKEKTNE